MGWVEGTWGYGAGTWGGFRGAASWNETFRITLGDSGLRHAVWFNKKCMLSQQEIHAQPVIQWQCSLGVSLMHMHKPLEVMFKYIDISCFSLLVSNLQDVPDTLLTLLAVICQMFLIRWHAFFKWLATPSLDVVKIFCKYLARRSWHVNTYHILFK